MNIFKNKSSSAKTIRIFMVGLPAVSILSGIAHLLWRRQIIHSPHGLVWFFLGLLALVLTSFLWQIDSGIRLNGWRWLVKWEAARLYGWTMAGGVSILVLFYSVELWRGKWAWTAVMREADALGEKLNFSGLQKPPVPDVQNAAKLPLFEPLFDLETNAMGTITPRGSAAYKRLQDLAQSPSKLLSIKHDDEPAWLKQRPLDFKQWRAKYNARNHEGNHTEVASPKIQGEDAFLAIRAVDEFAEELRALRTASNCPYARFPMSYKTVFDSVNPPSPGILYGASRLLGLRASAELVLHQDEAAFEDVKLALRVADYARQQPWALGHFRIDYGIVHALQPLWEGLAEQRWSETQLEALQTQLSRLNLLENYADTVHLDIYYLADFVDLFIPATTKPRPVPDTYDHTDQTALALARLVYPRGWSLLDQAALYRYYLEVMLPALNVAEQRLTPEKQSHMDLCLASSDPFFPVFIVPKARQIAQDSVRNYQFIQTGINQALLACALERYRLANGQYPQTLSALIPRFIDKAPIDIINGQPLKYRRDDDGQFLLYSVGLNGIDDGGVPGARGWWDNGDWVWKYPSNKTR